MIWDYSWIFIVIIAVIVDFFIGEFPGKHPVEYLGDFVKKYEEIAYENSVFRGFLLLAGLVFSTGLVALIVQSGLLSLPVLFRIPVIFPVIILGLIASMCLASKTLKDYVKNVIYAPDNKKREQLAIIVTRNTELLDDKKVYSSLIETHSENLSDGVIAPLFYLLLFGLPGIVIYKTVSTLDSMIGYKNEKYEKFGKSAAILDDILNYIPSRLTAFMIMIFSENMISWGNLSKEAKAYSSSPNAGYPVVAAAYNLGVKLGGTVHYGNTQVNKAEVGIERTDDYKQAAFKMLELHSDIDKLILVFFVAVLALNIL